MKHEIFYQLGDDEPVSMGEIPEGTKTYIPFTFRLTDESVQSNKGAITRHHHLLIEGYGKTFKMFSKPAKDKLP